jgi:hypothetical protein
VPYRSIWAATALAVLMIVLSRGAALRPANGLALLAIFCVLCSTAIVPRIHEAVIQRASSIKALKGDASLETRLQQYASLTRNDQLIAGEGLAINGASRRLDKKLPVAIDSAFIEIARALGVIAGTIFLVSMAIPVFALFGPAASIGNHVYFDRAIVAATALQLPMGSVHIGELGFCAWMFCGLGLAAQILKAEEA